MGPEQNAAISLSVDVNTLITASFSVAFAFWQECRLFPLFFLFFSSVLFILPPGRMPFSTNLHHISLFLALTREPPDKIKIKAVILRFTHISHTYIFYLCLVPSPNYLLHHVCICLQVPPLSSTPFVLFWCTHPNCKAARVPQVTVISQHQSCNSSHYEW